MLKFKIMRIDVRLKELRRQHGITQRVMADYLDVSERAYQHYELGTREPPLSKAVLLADYFNVSLDYLVGRSDNVGKAD